MGILIAIIVYLAIFGIPFLAGWWILRRKKSCHFFIFTGAVFLSFIYFSGASALQMIHNDDMPDYIHINEAFMFTAEKNFGLKKLYDGCQEQLADGKKLPFKYCRVWQRLEEEITQLGFFITRGNAGALTINQKAPDKNFQQSALDDVFERYCLSVWNKNCRVVSDKYIWERRFDSTLPFYKSFFRFTILLMCSLTWLFPLAAVACKVQRRWLFGIMWGAVLALYLMNFFNWSKQTPSLQYERCDAQTALAEISKAENQPTLSALLAHDTALLENDKSKTIIDAPMLCSGKFFTANFLCWDLGKSNYLYYSPTDLIEAQLLTNYAKIHRPRENFYLVSYPDFTRRSNNIWWQFVIIQTIAGSLWLAMFIFALKNRREEKETQEHAER